MGVSLGGWVAVANPVWADSVCFGCQSLVSSQVLVGNGLGSHF